MINIVQNCSCQGDKVKNCLTERQNAAYITDGNTGVKRAGGKSTYSRKLCGMFYVKQKGGAGDIRGKNRRSSCLFGRVALFLHRRLLNTQV